MANFTIDIINQVWEKGTVVDAYNKDKYRKDNCGAWMDKDKYGTEEDFGWEIDHVYPIAKGGDDSIINLRPMQWQNNRSKNNSYPSYQCLVRAKESKNVASEETRIINTTLQSELELKYKIKQNMNKNNLILLMLFMSIFSFGQKTAKEEADGNQVKVYIDSDINFSSSANDSRSESKAGIGKLGLKFESGFYYGGVNFTVFSQNKTIETTDSNEVKLFGTNLLLPQNSSSNISNFSFVFGTRSFYPFDKVDDNTPILSAKRIGAVVNWNINNTKWTKDTLSTPITISTFNLFITYNLLNLEILGGDNENEQIKLFLMAGYTNRRLGGDYGLDKDLQLKFLETNRLAFDGTYLGCRLEIGKFYGQMNLTHFRFSDKIKGFSGDQAVISLGIRADLKLAAKQIKKK